MPDLLPVSLVEMVAEMERDLLARKRSYPNKRFTRRLTHERAERRLLIVQAVVDNLRAQLSLGELEALRETQQKRKQTRRKTAN